MSLNTVENKSIVCRLLQKRVGRKGLLISRLFQRHWHIRRRERRAFAFFVNTQDFGTSSLFVPS